MPRFGVNVVGSNGIFKHLLKTTATSIQIGMVTY